MFGLYLFAAVVGWAFVAFFVFFAGDTDADFDGGGLDLDAEVDLDVDIAVDGGTSLADTATDFLSFRSLVFFLAGFGLTGIVLDVLSAGSILTFAAALALGVFALYLNTRLVRFLKRSGVSSDLRTADIVGVPGRVVLPIGSGRKGRITLNVGGRRLYLVALPFRDDADFAVGDNVVVIELEEGTALVSPLDDIGA